MEFNWRVEKICKSDVVGDLSNVVTWAYFACEKIVDGNVERSRSVLFKFPEPSQDSFLEYSSLTEEEVLSWVSEEAKDSVVKGLEAQETLAIYQRNWESEMPWQTA